MSDPTNTTAATVNTTAQTVDTDAHTTDTDADTTDAPGSVEYPDGSTAPIDPETGLPLLEDRSDEFEFDADPGIETSDGRVHHLGPGSGMSAYMGLGAKRAQKALTSRPSEHPAPESADEHGAALALAVEAGLTEDDLLDDEGNPLDAAGIHERVALAAQGGSEEPGGDSDPTDPENGAQTGAEDAEPSEPEEVTEPEAEEVPEPEFEPESDEEPKSDDEGFEPGEHTVDEVQAYLTDNPGQSTYVLDRERAGKARKTLIGA